jgi:shikimate kinase
MDPLNICGTSGDRFISMYVSALLENSSSLSVGVSIVTLNIVTKVLLRYIRNEHVMLYLKKEEKKKKEIKLQRLRYYPLRYRTQSLL